MVCYIVITGDQDCAVYQNTGPGLELPANSQAHALSNPLYFEQEPADSNETPNVKCESSETVSNPCTGIESLGRNESIHAASIIESSGTDSEIQTGLNQEPVRDNLLECECANEYSPLTYEKAREDNISDPYLIPVKGSSIKHKPKDKEKNNQLPEYALVDKSKKTSSRRNSDNAILDSPNSSGSRRVTSSVPRVPPTEQFHIYSEVQRESSFPVYADVVLERTHTKGRGSATATLPVQNKGQSLSEIDNVHYDDVKCSTKDPRNQEKKEHYYFSLENLAESKGACDVRDGKTKHSSGDVEQNYSTPQADHQVVSDSLMNRAGYNMYATVGDY